MSDQVRTEDAGTYQMLWDCPRCDTPNLLGLTHRHCPNCGAPQDPSKRRFPSDDEKIAVEDHPLAGADLECPACNTANSASAKCCGGCGYPLDEAKQVGGQDDIVLGEGEGFAGQTAAEIRQAERDRQAALRQPAKPEPKTSWLTKRTMIIGGVIFAVVLLVFLFTRKKEVQIEVSGHSWSRSIEIEQYGAVDESAWCDRMPAKAKLKNKRSEVREKKKVPDGETCKTRKVDNRDGTFKEVKECKPKYREEPVYADKCYYTIDKWHRDRSADAQGSALSPEPNWPKVGLRKTGKGNCRGCEREGSRSESYKVLFSYEGDEDSCTFSQDKWKSFALGDRFSAKAGRMTGNLDCDSLVAH